MQIMTLCGRLPRVEWSGTLFYDVQGEFGEPGFSIEAKELYLQDIGTSSYTEYETNDPEFYQVLMQRPELRTMRMGHIHSHNTMGSFFSGTDDDELIENSEFHNYYFSLIVNNENEMVAKVAFRAEVESETVANIKFKGTDGQIKERHTTNKTQTTHVYAYGCEIEVPGVVSETIVALEKQEEKEQARKMAQRQSKGGIYGSYSSYQTPTYNGRLFGDEPEEEVVRVPNESTEPEDQGEPEEVVETRSEKKRGGKWRTRPGRPLNRKSVDFLVKLIKLDKDANGMIEESLEEVVRDVWRKHEAEQYFEDVSNKFPFLYMDVFPEDHKLDEADDIIMDCIEILDLYSDKYPNFTERMNEILTKHLTPTV